MKALLDVSEVLTDPDLASSFTVIRREQTINTHGRAVNSPQEVFKNQIGVICSASKNDLDRLPDYQQSGRHISIVTTFRLQMTTPNMQADTVVWEGDSYVVQYLDPYPQYGEGFVQAICGSLDSQDQPVQ